MRARSELTFQVAIFIARPIFDLRPRSQTANELPQPQDELAFGVLTRK
jgi:hypothetical protein